MTESVCNRHKMHLTISRVNYSDHVRYSLTISIHYKTCAHHLITIPSMASPGEYVVELIDMT